MDLQYGDHGYSTCVMRARSSHEKAERRGAFLPPEPKLLEIV